MTHCPKRTLHGASRRGSMTYAYASSSHGSRWAIFQSTSAKHLAVATAGAFCLIKTRQYLACRYRSASAAISGYVHQVLQNRR